MDYISYTYRGEKVFYDIELANYEDRLYYKLKKDCTLFRLIGSLNLHKTIVTINREKKLLYFLKDYKDECFEWETKGIKLDFSVTIH